MTKNMLLYEIAPLMQWRNISGSEAAHKLRSAGVPDADRTSETVEQFR